MNALDLDILEIRPVWRLVPEAMGQIVELEPHAVVEILLERDTADFLVHRTSSLAPFQHLLRDARGGCERRRCHAPAVASWSSSARRVANSRSAIRFSCAWK